MIALHLNCDCGERGTAHPEDAELLDQVDLINIACGGHAGDASSAQWLHDLAQGHNTACSLHLSYPDPEHFGRRSLWGSLSWDELSASLDSQRALLPELKVVKFHGALYNDAAVIHELAEHLADWLTTADIGQVLAPPGSALAQAASQRGLACLREGFADRRYIEEAGVLRLAPRSQTKAVHSPDDMLAQVASVVEHGYLTLEDRQIPFACDTWCVHSDSPGALSAITALRRWSHTCS